MDDSLSLRLREFLVTAEGKDVSLDYLRKELRIDPNKPAWDGLRVLMLNLTREKIVRPSGKKDGIYRVVTQVKPIEIFGVKRERRPPFELLFPTDRDTGMEMDFAEHIVIREGDLVNISGLSNYGKSTLCLGFCGENIDKLPVLMGNEYSTPDLEPTPRFLNKLDTMDWVEWTNGDGYDKFTLLPVRGDYAEHIVKDRINIIDWINLEGGQLYEISPLMEEIKRALGRGIAIISLQKSEGEGAGRGGQFTKDFTDCELLLDKLGNSETLLTIGKVKEYTEPVMGKTFAFGISKGVGIVSFREVKKCYNCYGKGYTKAGECDVCIGTKYVDKE